MAPLTLLTPVSFRYILFLRLSRGALLESAPEANGANSLAVTTEPTRTQGKDWPALTGGLPQLRPSFVFTRRPWVVTFTDGCWRGTDKYIESGPTLREETALDAFSQRVTNLSENSSQTLSLVFAPGLILKGLLDER